MTIELTPNSRGALNHKKAWRKVSRIPLTSILSPRGRGGNKRRLTILITLREGDKRFFYRLKQKIKNILKGGEDYL